jgi:hypothetical protein
MPKEFYTERDIEDLVKRGVLSLELNENVVLTELAYEKAGRLGMHLVRSKPDNPPSAPVRPYLSQPKTCNCPPQPSGTPAATPSDPARTPAEPAGDLNGRIRSAVLARMGGQVDPALLDVIIERVLKSTGLK